MGKIGSLDAYGTGFVFRQVLYVCVTVRARARVRMSACVCVCVYAGLHVRA